MKLSAMMTNLRFVIFAYWDLRHIKKYRKMIHKYVAEGNRPLEREQIGLLQNTWGSRLFDHVGVDVHITGQENIPEEPVVIVANHQGYGDIPLLTQIMAGRQFGCVAKEELERVPVFHKIIEEVRSVYIRRNDARASLRAIEQGIEYLKEGYTMAIFPEGTRSHGPEMGTFKKGSLRLATKPGVPVVPVTISGTYKIFEETGVVGPARVDVFVHPPIYTKDMDRKEAAGLAETVEEIVRHKLLELQAEEAKREGEQR